MVNPDDSVFVSDILDAVSRIEGFVGGMDFESFSEDEKTIRAVLYDLAVVGEAAKKTTESFRKQHEEIPWEEIFGMRNKLVHDYMGVRVDIVWQTVKVSLPKLKKQIIAILEKEK
jgi:hypothetical protein